MLSTESPSTGKPDLLWRDNGPTTAPGHPETGVNHYYFCKLVRELLDSQHRMVVQPLYLFLGEGPDMRRNSWAKVLPGYVTPMNVFRLAALLLAGLLARGPLFAQGDTGRISGDVTDQ